MPTYHTYNVIPTLPAALEPLREIGVQFVVDLGALGPPSLPPSRSRALESHEP